MHTVHVRSRKSLVGSKGTVTPSPEPPACIYMISSALSGMKALGQSHWTKTFKAEIIEDGSAGVWV